MSIMASGASGAPYRNHAGVVDGVQGFSYVERNAHVDEAIKREQWTEKRLAADEREKSRAFNVNPYNRANHHFVTGKVLGRENPSGDLPANEAFLRSTERTNQPAAVRYSLPQTSSQEIGWFTRTHSVTDYRKDTRVNHPQRHSELVQYMSTFWKYYPSDPSLLRGATNPGAATKRQ